VLDLSIRVSPSHPYNAGRAGLWWGVGGSQEMCALHAVVVVCFWCQYRTKFLVLYLGILCMSLLGESFHVYPRLIHPQTWLDLSVVIECIHTMSLGMRWVENEMSLWVWNWLCGVWKLVHLVWNTILKVRNACAWYEMKTQHETKKVFTRYEIFV
jgi:hypothetical protein